ncbi:MULTISPECIES: pentapeptide repeat-containing protein [Actinomadura]|uniref:Pentapeptide repeat-containing protein n=1 Tax=Actinomadura geliboluensis TaxID=882440 RepID=A0A5S4GN30_9ACTN|nr:pentapeptide repeat-containing protein [Actinomadura geliboluensis]TMR33934.1 pentapeptide repeat-containing protein [Actinomadura geliboluensis]
MSRDKTTPEYRPVKDAHKTLGLWSIRRALTFAFTTAVVLLVAAWFLLSLLLGSPSHAEPKPLETKDLLDLLKLVFALVAGVGALVALVTAYRRQRVDEAAGERAERVQAHVEYGQGVELLGHDRAAVRLGGLYSLERLAQDHPYYRQTVTDVVCSYLRMPFPALPSGQDDQSEQPADHTTQDPELQVRLTAQRLLKRHLTITDPDQQPPTYWDSIHIDLTGAYLIDFNFRNCHPTSATFTKTHFSGEAGFVGAKFSGDAGFVGANFSGDAWFNSAEFSGEAEFVGAKFSGDAWFNSAEFSGGTKFDQAKFSGNAEFLGAMFHHYTYFDWAEFSGDAKFVVAEFSGSAWFGDAKFSGDAEFGEAEFGGEAWFGRAEFSGDAKFDEAEFAQEPNFVEAKATYPNVNNVWPSPWRVEGEASGMARLTRGG